MWLRKNNVLGNGSVLIVTALMKERFIEFTGSQIMENVFTSVGGTFKILKELQPVMRLSIVFKCYPEASACPL
jgi:hypothetical protein